jgi:hypothetical protein
MKSKKRIWSAELCIKNLTQSGKKVSEFLGKPAEVKRKSNTISPDAMLALIDLKRKMI